MGVALPPMSVPIASVQASMDRSTPYAADRLLIIGIIVVAKGMLSTNALTTADSHMIMAVITITFPPLILPINAAIISSIPVCSSPPITTNRPIKNSSVL